MTNDPSLHHLNKLVGDWTTEATHPALPGVVARGTTFTRWLDGERFLVQRGHTDHPDFPDYLAVIGNTADDRIDESETAETPATSGPLTMHYFDSRGVFRVYNVEVDAVALRIWRDAPGFSQRFAGRFEDNGNTINGQWHLSRDDTTWDDDVHITYRRQ
jgi:hypothetical protein